MLRTCEGELFIAPPPEAQDISDKRYEYHRHNMEPKTGDDNYVSFIIATPQFVLVLKDRTNCLFPPMSDISVELLYLVYNDRI